MHYEVEQKYPVDDLAAMEATLAALGACFETAIEQRDRYFAHPSRDFAQTDEALRIRQVGRQCYVTYKGPKIDPATKTRREIELPVSGTAEAAGQWTLLWESLGFQLVTEVCKRRRPGRIRWEDADILIALDQVDGVGTFVELELAVSADGLERAKLQILSLAAALGLANAERRSYLELLLTAIPNADSPLAG
ncbi:MAG: class IV adenylate cyclase [Candidatus Anammoximicrobium sp.]|nr:class IV adenylate cyclase [Candidatus Anammoximicrobium sp.]